MHSGTIVHIITGGKHQGKTTLLRDVVHILAARQTKLQGFFSEGEWFNDVRSKYFLTNILSGSKHLLCQRETNDKWIRGGCFYFSPETIILGNSLLKVDTSNPPDLLVVDEVGQLETQGMIWEPALSALLKSATLPFIWTVRDTSAEKVIRHFDLHQYQLYPVGITTPESIANSIQKHF